jgi:hypothetical protein
LVEVRLCEIRLVCVRLAVGCSGSVLCFFGFDLFRFGYFRVPEIHVDIYLPSDCRCLDDLQHSAFLFFFQSYFPVLMAYLGLIWNSVSASVLSGLVSELLITPSSVAEPSTVLCLWP